MTYLTAACFYSAFLRVHACRGVLVAVVCFLALLIKWLIVTGGGDIE